jgi:hypothetical protein
MHISLGDFAKYYKNFLKLFNKKKSIYIYIFVFFFCNIYTYIANNDHKHRNVQIKVIFDTKINVPLPPFPHFSSFEKDIM